MYYRMPFCKWIVGGLVYFMFVTSAFIATSIAQEIEIANKGIAESTNAQPPSIETIEAHDEYVYLIVFSADGKTMATSAGDNQAVLWDWPNRKKVHSLAHDAAVYAAQIHPDGSQIASSSGDGRVTIWSTKDGSKIKEVSDHENAVHCLAYSKDGKYLASVGGDGRKGDTDCRIWESEKLTLLQKLPGHQRPAYWVGFSPNGKTLITSGGDQAFHVWKVPKTEVGKEPFLKDRQIIVGHDSDVYRCDVSADGRWLATAGQDKTVKIWDLNSIPWQRSKDRSQPQAQDEKTKTTNGDQDLSKGIDLKPTRILGNTKDPYYAAKFSRDGKLLATVGDDGSLRVWDAEHFELSGIVKLCAAALYAVAFTPDNKFVVAGGADGELFVVEVAELLKQSK